MKRSPSRRRSTDDHAGEPTDAPRDRRLLFIVAGVIIAAALLLTLQQIAVYRSLVNEGSDSIHVRIEKRHDAHGRPLLVVSHPQDPGLVSVPLSISPPSETRRPESEFIGAVACSECHAKRFEGFSKTAHHNTSRLASPETVTGSFTPGENVMSTSNPNLRFEMIAKDDRLFQKVKYHEFEREFPIDFSIGSGKIGQSFLYWVGDELCQLHVSYLSDLDSWVNSPGYQDGVARNHRAAGPRCMSCHTTYFDHLAGSTNRYDRHNFILGISCERCHGPGRQHRDYHQQNPEAVEAAHIVSPREQLNRTQMNDLCAQCHGGVGTMLKSAFHYQPGDPLDEYVEFDAPTDSKSGVHTNNQLARFKESLCYQNSEITCADCHNPHKYERGDFAVFSQRCMQCHEPEHCGMSSRFESDLTALTSNCIECHMPPIRDTATFINLVDGAVFPTLRDHYIRVDRQATEQFLQSR